MGTAGISTSHAPTIDETVDIAMSICGGVDQKDDVVAGGVAAIPRHLVIGNDDLCSQRNMRTLERAVRSRVRDDRDVLAVLDVDLIGVLSISFTAAR
jgi:hypothetical protein